ncbi:MAG TPA: cell wall-binding repeat-containing protein, partial [Firmicutes bacterium]|nr:cell wall-binding repeat-containing protein [Bacillota bacterium]
MFKTKKYLTLIMVLLFVLMTLPPGEVTAASAVSRIGGADRYQTAVNISKQGWSYSDLVVLARGDDYADALAGVPLASWYNAPILLTRGNVLPDSTLNEIERLGAGKVIILGGSKAVSAEVENKLKGKSLEVERIGGENRFATAAGIAKKLGMLDVVFLAYGYNFPDALAAASYAGARGYPILLTD